MYAFAPAVIDEITGPDPRDIGFHLLPTTDRSGPGGGRWTAATSSTSERQRRCAAPATNGKAGLDVIITQTPLRVGLVGGGTDLPGYYREHGGRVLNAAIDKYIYVIVKQRFDDDIYVNYSQKEIVSRVEDIQHELVREAMYMTGVRSGVEITTLADIPSAGSGLGSSSAVTVGFAPRAVRVPRATGDRAGAGRTGLHDRDRPLPQADRQAGPVRGRLRRDLRPALRPRRSRRRGADQRSRPRCGGSCRTSCCCSTPAPPAARTRSSTSSPRTLPTGCRSSPSCATWPARRRTGLRGGDVEAVGVAMNKSWEAKRALASGVSNSQIDQAVEARWPPEQPAPR